MNIFIPGNVPSSKNSKRWVRFRLINSQIVMDYKKTAILYFMKYEKMFREHTAGLEKPLHIEFTFVRNSKRLFDFVNMAQVVQDLMVDCNWIDDDNYKEVVPYFNPKVKINKFEPGVFIKILPK